jgi:CubicO group peptidase (beta-lactamase class C family)
MNARYVVAAVLLSVTRLSASSASTENHQRPVVAALDRFLTQHLADVPIPGFSVVVVRDGVVVLQKGYGVEVAGSSRPMSARSPVAVGSLAKSFTAVAMMRLVEAGKVDLDAPVVRYLPWFRTADRRGAEISVRMLLQNTSGIPSGEQDLFSQDTDEAAIEREVRALSAVSLVRAPGKSFEYSNENWSVAGTIIAEVSGMPYSAFLEREVLQPLGMTHSSTALRRIREMGGLWGHYAEPHGVRPAAPKFLAAGLPAGSELRVSAEDMGRYLAMLLRKGMAGHARFLTEASVALLFTPGSITTVSMPDIGLLGGKMGYGMGWAVMEVDGRTVIHHGGDAIVMGSWAMIDPLTRTAASILYNGPNLDPYRYPSKVWVVNNLLHLAAAQPLSKFGLPREADPTLNTFELPPDRFERYEGTYLSGDGQRLTITRAADGKRLLLAMTAGQIRFSDELDFASEGSAVLRNVSGSSVTSFLVTPSGQVTGLAGGIPGGVYHKLTAGQLARIQEIRSPSGRLRIQLPRGWVATWSEDGFEARSESDSTAVIHGSFTARNALRPKSAGTARSQTIGRYEWAQRIWSDGEGESRRQQIEFSTPAGGREFRLTGAVGSGRLTALLRDVLLPLMTAIDVPTSLRAPFVQTGEEITRSPNRRVNGNQ